MKSPVNHFSYSREAFEEKMRESLFPKLEK